MISLLDLLHLSAENLRGLLESISGSKDLVIHETLMKPLDKIIRMSALKRLGVQKVFRFSRNDAPINCNETHRFYLLPPNYKDTEAVIRHFSQTLPSFETHIIYIPKILISCEKLIESEGLFGKISLHSFSWELIPVDRDLMTLELPFGPFRNPCLLSSVTKSLFGVIELFGDIPTKIAIGNDSLAILKQLELYTAGTPMTNTYTSSSSSIETLILLDRQSDWMSLLLSPLTYEALLDEVFGIVLGSIKLDSNLTQGSEVLLQLSDKDQMFSNIRRLHFSSIFSSLSSITRSLKASQKQGQESLHSVKDLKHFVHNNLKDFTSHSRGLKLHLAASERIQSLQGPLYERLLPFEYEALHGKGLLDSLSFLMDLIAQRISFPLVLRFLCLLSLSHHGFSKFEWSSIKTQILQAYGFTKLLTLSKCESLGLLNQRENSDYTPFSTFAKQCNLLPKSDSDLDMRGTKDPSYVFNGHYLPLILRIVTSYHDSVSKGNSKILEETLKSIPYKTQYLTISKSTKQPVSKIVFLYFIGGFTLAEVAALRTFQISSGLRFLIAGTSSISGTKFFQTLDSME